MPPISRSNDDINILSSFSVADLGNHECATQKNDGCFNLHICKFLAEKTKILYTLSAWGANRSLHNVGSNESMRSQIKCKMLNLQKPRSK